MQGRKDKETVYFYGQDVDYDTYWKIMMIMIAVGAMKRMRK